MALGLEESEIKGIWDSVSSGNQICPSRSKRENVAKLCQIFVLFQRQRRILLDGLQSKDKQFLADFLQSKTEIKPFDMDWKVRIIVGNSFTQKSLHPVTEISIDGKKFEFDLEGISKARLALSHALLLTEKQ